MTLGVEAKVELQRGRRDGIGMLREPLNQVLTTHRAKGL